MHIGDPGHQPHRRDVARAHGDQQAWLAVAREQRHAPAQPRREVAEIGERRMLGHVAVDQHGLEALLVHDAVERVHADLELVARNLVLVPRVVADDDRGIDGTHGYTATTSSSATRADSALAPAGVITT